LTFSGSTFWDLTFPGSTFSGFTCPGLVLIFFSTPVASSACVEAEAEDGFWAGADELLDAVDEAELDEEADEEDDALDAGSLEAGVGDGPELIPRSMTVPGSTAAPAW
jgi:hypothetical protein